MTGSPARGRSNSSGTDPVGATRRRRSVRGIGYGAPVELTELDGSRIPVHVAIVMDGNGRWAQRRGLPRPDGHAAGEEALMDTIWGALDAGVEGAARRGT